LKFRWIASLLASTLVASSQTQAQDANLSAHVKVLRDGSAAARQHEENVVVWLKPIDSQIATQPGSATNLRLTQRNKSFEPHVLVVPVGAVVEFPNRDPFFHNVFSLFDGKRFDLGLYEAGSTRNVSFDRPGISYIFCNIHAEMSAVVIALDTPYFAVSNRRGEIVIPHVPPGHYLLHVWYESALPPTLKALTREVNVTPDSSTLGVLQIPAEMTVHAHKNKYGMDYEPAPPSSAGYGHP
jgi:plastocyanin